MSRIFRPITETKYGILYLKTIFFYTESEMSPISETSTNDHESSEEEESWTVAKDEQYKDRMVADNKAGFSEGNVYNGKTCKTFLLTVGFKIFDWKLTRSVRNVNNRLLRMCTFLVFLGKGCLYLGSDETKYILNWVKQMCQTIIYGRWVFPETKKTNFNKSYSIKRIIPG